MIYDMIQEAKTTAIEFATAAVEMENQYCVSTLSNEECRAIARKFHEVLGRHSEAMCKLISSIQNHERVNNEH